MVINPVLLWRVLTSACVVSPLGDFISHMPVRMNDFGRLRYHYARYNTYN